MENLTKSSPHSASIKSDATPKIASFWERFFAFQVDSVILIALLYTLLNVIYFILDYARVQYLFNSISISFVIFITLSYFSFFDSSNWKGTPGKRLLGLRVTTERGLKIGRKTSVSRTFLSFFSAIFLFYGFLSQLSSKNNQSLHDKFTKTLVLRKKDNCITRGKYIGYEKIVIIASSVLIFLPQAVYSVVFVKNEAVPIINDAKQKRRISSAIDLVEPMKKSIEESITKTGKFPKIDHSIIEEINKKSDSVLVYSEKTGALSIQFNEISKGRMEIVSIFLRKKSNSEYKWECISFGISDKFLPLICKKNK